MILDVIYQGNTLHSYFIFLIFMFFGIFFGKLSYIVINKYVKTFTKKTKTKLDDIFLNAIEFPIIIVLFVIFTHYGLNNLVLQDSVYFWINESLKVALTFAGIIFTIKIVDDILLNYMLPLVEKSENKLDDQLLPIFRKLLKIFIFLSGILLILSNIGYNISALLTGLGIGGLAVALAAKDTIENFIAGILIIIDRPFTLGDWIKWGNQEGIIEEVGIRSTRIRSFGDTLITVPNARIIQAEIENFSARRKRQVKTTIGLTYDTPVEKVELAKEIIKDILTEHHGVLDPIRVSFVEFSSFSLDLRVEYFIRDFGFDFYLNTKDEVNLKIKERFNREKIEFAFPTQTIYYKKDD
ncbi:MscS Mechanosensitive ion channel [Methanococcus vannielii SB]|uniref:MscS Mechanosensitive ion channel n=1 Tax=Methanococcus vannielii (strain ATCC 35089 / DSM 1224 / JCM 13029 / OCM 148 / SB) TaxID=406327 RepID=A6URQ2_METVS|nr:mechanosensitive ion channel family protein [Methanococcus vannielii]ABR55174.1 MscS Mechanosensitive ion channel [Methanococcus vannielii SB]